MNKPPPAPTVLQGIQGLILDCDGVLTDGKIPYDTEGRRTLNFFAQDGMGLSMLCRSGFKVAVLSGRPADIAELRHKELGVLEFVGQSRNKRKDVATLAAKLGLGLKQCAYVGDDLADLGAMEICGLSIAVSNSVPEILDIADWVTQREGGAGAVREVCDALLRAHGLWDGMIQRLREG